MSMKILQVYFRLSQLSDLRKLSKKHGLSIAELIRRAVDKFLAEQKNGGTP